MVYEWTVRYAKAKGKTKPWGSFVVAPDSGFVFTTHQNCVYTFLAFL